MSLDPKTGKIIQNRVYDKINYQTSFTDFKIFYLYCKTFKNYGFIKEGEINSILGKERKKTNAWENDNDSHARVTLLQYNLIGKINEDNYALSTIGSSFLSLFDEDGNLSADQATVFQTCYDMLMAWHQYGDGFDVHPGYIILKLLLQPELHDYITDQDIALIFNNSSNKSDSQYDDFVRQILEFRDSGVIYTKSELKKTYTLLTGYANNWGIFKLLPRSNGTIKYVSMVPEFRELVCNNFNIYNEDKVLSDQDFKALVTKEKQLSDLLAEFEKKYGPEGMAIKEQKARASEIQKMYRNRLISQYGQKCLMCSITNKELLVASHIKAFVECKTLEEKIDNNNGFLLCAIHDKLFDRCLISFNARNGMIMISHKLSEDEIIACNLDKNYRLPSDLLTSERRKYLVWHNSEFEKKERE